MELSLSGEQLLVGRKSAACSTARLGERWGSLGMGYLLLSDSVSTTLRKVDGIHCISKLVGYNDESITYLIL